MGKHIFSFFENEQDCISSILKIHNDGKGIELDPMYNRGMFYKNTLSKPKFRFDVNASKNGYDAKDGDATNLPLDNHSIHSMILDPSFMFGSHGQTKNNVINKRYTMFDNFAELERCYKGILKKHTGFSINTVFYFSNAKIIRIAKQR